jgi:hypothetical protein
VHEASHVIEDVSAIEKSAKHLRVDAVQPLSAKLERMRAMDDREVVSGIRMPEHFV